VYSLSRYFGRKVQLGPANRQQTLGLVWRNRKKINQIINDYLCLPFFLLIILWEKMRRTNLKNEEGGGRIKRGGLFKREDGKSERD
jgi:hypothetical protein